LIERAGKWLFLNSLPGDLSVAEKALRQAGSSLAQVARLDQYYAAFEAVGPYHAARKAAFAPRQVAPSSSIVVGRLPREAAIEVHLIAVRDETPTHLSAGLSRPDASGYTPCLRAGDMVFMAGQLARDGSDKLAARGVGAETTYMLRNRIAPALAASGSGLDLVLKAQAYVSDPAHLPEFWQAWKQAFPEGVPPTLAVPLPHPAFLTREATVEINVIAAHADARSRVKSVDCAACSRILDGLLFLEGLGSEAEAQAALQAAGARAVRMLKFGSEIGIAPGSHPVVDAWGYVQ
jgi:enamine deaminase RidA (YjgF/YER057c/UK114 family)